ncbi:MAG TPA: helix-turn-helix transcriptional regulator, partial [Dehalococcoidia bacterium]|nr:helix-turn-helix transcriptional regulator [Dehalococcoidia bacterium]
MRRWDPDDLTPREREVLDLIRLGLTNEEIAQRLSITVAGAKYHVSQILSKLGVATREEAAAVAFEERRAWWARWPLWAKIAGAATLVAAVAGLAVLGWGVLRTEGNTKGTLRIEGPRRVDGPIGGPREGVAYCLQAVGVASEFERQAQVVIEASLPAVDRVRASLTENDNVPETVDIGCPLGPEILVERCPPHDRPDDFRSLCPRAVDEAGRYELFIFVLPQHDLERLTEQTQRITEEEVIVDGDTATATS